jgi:hypothetical protein
MEGNDNPYQPFALSIPVPAMIRLCAHNRYDPTNGRPFDLVRTFLSRGFDQVEVREVDETTLEVWATGRSYMQQADTYPDGSVERADLRHKSQQSQFFYLLEWRPRIRGG